jgi:predicted acylesterase/phospholipase RssA
MQCIAVIRHGAGGEGFARELAQALQRHDGDVILLDESTMREFTAATVDDASVAARQVEAWISSLEDEHRFVLLAGGPEADAWTRLAMRRADAVLLVATAGADPTPCAAERGHDRHVAHVSTSADMAELAALAAANSQRRELVLLQTPDRSPSGTALWYVDRRLDAHHHVRRTATACDAADLARVVRFLRGEAVGVALSGGGARGFSHIGMLRALDEAGIPVDVVVGTSMGAVVGAQYALGFDHDRMVAANLAAFPEADVVRDFTVPIVALMKGRSTVDMFRTMYGDAQLEDCRIRCRMVSTSLTRSAVVVHDRGPIWLWARSSTSVPGIGPPVIADGELLVDGGVMDNLPVGPLQDAGANILLACDVTSSAPMVPAMEDRAWISGWPLLWRLLRRSGGSAPVPSLLAIMTRTSTMASAYRIAGVGSLVDLHLRPPTEEVPTMAWRTAAEVAEIGYRYALPVVTAWAKSRAGTPPR